jgi:DNA-binding CsgD family transcriptional regulator
MRTISLTTSLLQFCDDVLLLKKPHDVIDALEVVLRDPATAHIHVMGAWFVPPVHDLAAYRSENVFWQKDLPQGFAADYWSGLAEHGSSPMQIFARTCSAPFTVSEAMRTIRPTGRERWLFSLLRQYGIRDGLYCPFRNWMLLYWSRRGPCSSSTNEIRALLGMAAQAAVGRIETLVRRPDRFTKKPRVTARENHILRLAASGFTGEQIAEQLQISAKTAEHLRESAIHRLGAKNVTEACIIAIRTGLIS